MDLLHQPVLLAEVLASLAIEPDGIYVDATFGRGGHSQAIIECLADTGRLYAIDRDPEAVAFGRALLINDKRFQLEQKSFAELSQWMQQHALLGRVNGILFDLGVSSPQLDEAMRGFSFMQDGPLDMRMDPACGISVGDWLATSDEYSIATVLYQYGDERYSRRIARAIIDYRTQQAITRTTQLAEIIAKAKPKWEKNIHPATRSFQALRIKVNDELDQLQKGLDCSLSLLAPGGKLCVVSFHSLEDRTVKRFIREQVRGGNMPAKLPLTAAQIEVSLKSVGKPIKASQIEINNNPRARSAVLRVAEKIK